MNGKALEEKTTKLAMSLALDFRNQTLISLLQEVLAKMRLNSLKTTVMVRLPSKSMERFRTWTLLAFPLIHQSRVTILPSGVRMGVSLSVITSSKKELNLKVTKVALLMKL